MRYRPRVLSVNDLFDWHQKGELDLNPDFQRRPVWSAQARSYFIDTLLLGLPIPAVQIRQIIDTSAQTTRREVVDGQQRLRALFDFLSGDLRVLPSQSVGFGGLRYRDLDEGTQSELLDYEVPVAMLSGASDSDVLSVFARLNSYTIVLNAQEKLNAKYFGLFKQEAYALGAEHNSFWLRQGVLTKRAILRMGEADLASELLVAMLKGMTDKRKAIEPTYKELDETFPRRKQVGQEFRETIDKLDAVFGNAIKDSEFSRRPLFFSLFCAFYDRMYGLPKSGVQQGPIKARNKTRLTKALDKLSDQVLLDDPPRRYAAFRTASLRQTDNLGPRTTRLEAIHREFHGLYE